MVSEVFTLATLGAGVGVEVRNSWKLWRSLLTIFRVKSISPSSVLYSRTSGWLRMWAALASEMPDYNWSTAPNYLLVNGVELARYLTATYDAMNVTSGVLTIDTAAATDVGLLWNATTPLPGLSNRRTGLTIAIVSEFISEMASR